MDRSTLYQFTYLPYLPSFPSISTYLFSICVCVCICISIYYIHICICIYTVFIYLYTYTKAGLLKPRFEILQPGEPNSPEVNHTPLQSCHGSLLHVMSISLYQCLCIFLRGTYQHGAKDPDEYLRYLEDLLRNELVTEACPRVFGTTWSRGRSGRQLVFSATSSCAACPK